MNILRKIFYILVPVLFAGFCGAQNLSSERPLLRIVFENDVHCQTEGYPALAGLRDSLSRADGRRPLLVSSGDFLQGGYAGAATKGAAIVDLMRSVGYDVLVPGNHEFDFGSDRLFALLQRLAVPVTCCHLTAAGDSVPLFAPYVLCSWGDLCVGFVGVLTPSTAVTESYAFMQGDSVLYSLNPDRVVTLTQRAVDDARRSGADRVILLSHVGEYPSFKSSLTSHNLVRRLRGVDAVIDGHSHSVVPGIRVPTLTGDSILLVQTGCRFANVGVLTLGADGRFRAELHPAAAVTVRDTLVQHVLDSVSAALSVRADSLVGRTPFALSVDAPGELQLVRRAETNLGDFVTDSYRYVSSADIALCNGGGLRTAMPEGDITLRRIVDAQPYENMLCVARITGRQLLETLRQSSEALPLPEGAFLQVSGLRYAVDLHAAPSSPGRVCRVEVERSDSAGRRTWQPLDTEALYTVCASDYVLFNGGEHPALHGAQLLRNDLCSTSEAFLRFLNERCGGVVPECYRQPEGRITIIK